MNKGFTISSWMFLKKPFPLRNPRWTHSSCCCVSSASSRSSCSGKLMSSPLPLSICPFSPLNDPLSVIFSTILSHKQLFAIFSHFVPWLMTLVWHCLRPDEFHDCSISGSIFGSNLSHSSLPLSALGNCYFWEILCPLASFISGSEKWLCSAHQSNYWKMLSECW